MTKFMTTKTVLSEDIEDCSVDEMISKLNELKKQYPNEELHISYETEYEFEGPSYFTVYFNRIETDEEEKSRLYTEKVQLETYERLEMHRLQKMKNPNSVDKLNLSLFVEKYYNG